MVQLVDNQDVPSTMEELHEKLNAWTEKPRSPSDQSPRPFKREIVWFNAIGFLLFHLAGCYGLYIALFHAMFITDVWTVFVLVLGSEGVLMGAHRLFSHKSFKAKPPLRLALVLMQTLAGQNCLWVWVRDHRQHHKYSDTDADPHNATNGFFFSHIGWLMSRKHPEVIAKGKTIDMSDMEADPFVMFQKKYYKTLYTLLSLFFPVAVPCWLWGETLFNSFMVAYIFRTIFSLNGTWLVNSAAHKYGTRPYTKNILPVDTALIAGLTLGEGWHNYHHTFPWDYKAAELGQPLNPTAKLIEAAAWFGWAYDLRSPSPGVVASRVLNHGDGSHPTAITQMVDKMVTRTNRGPGL